VPATAVLHTPYEQSELTAHDVLHDIASAQTKRPGHGVAVRPPQVPFPSQEFTVSVLPLQDAVPHAVPMA
jgi:hypothetical protein